MFSAFLPRVIRFQRQDAVVGDRVGRSCNMGIYNAVYYDAEQVKSLLLLALHLTLRSSSSAWQILVIFVFSVFFALRKIALSLHVNNF